MFSLADLADFFNFGETRSRKVFELPPAVAGGKGKSYEKALAKKHEFWLKPFFNRIIYTSSQSRRQLK